MTEDDYHRERQSQRSFNTKILLVITTLAALFLAWVLASNKTPLKDNPGKVHIPRPEVNTNAERLPPSKSNINSRDYDMDYQEFRLEVDQILNEAIDMGEIDPYDYDNTGEYQ